MLTIPVFIPLSVAARKYGLDEASIRALVERGKIKAAMIDDQIFIPETDARAQQVPQVTRKEDLPEWKKHASLQGTAIWISEAERKYKIPNPTIWRWMKSGFIARLGTNGNKTLINEADVAYCAEIYRKRDAKQGRRLFDSNGLPYRLKSLLV